MENSKYKEIIENGDVYKEQLAIVHIPGTLHSDDANHVVTTSDEVYDIEIGKRQSEINKIQEGVVIEIAKIFNDINTLVSKQILINELIENIGDTFIGEGIQIDLTQYSSFLPPKVLLFSKSDWNNLINEIKKIAKENKCDNINLSVWSFNENAIKFYKHTGFKSQKINMEIVL
jgi:hypothetical protein